MLQTILHVHDQCMKTDSLFNWVLMHALQHIQYKYLLLHKINIHHSASPGTAAPSSVNIVGLQCTLRLCPTSIHTNCCTISFDDIRNVQYVLDKVVLAGKDAKRLFPDGFLELSQHEP